MLEYMHRYPQLSDVTGITTQFLKSVSESVKWISCPRKLKKKLTQVSENYYLVSNASLCDSIDLSIAINVYLY